MAWGESTNVLQTPSIIAKEALIALENNLVFAGLVYRAYDKEFRKVGDTINVRKPATFEAKEFDRSAGVTVQDIIEDTVPVVLDTLVDVSFELTAEQRALDIVSLSEQVIAPAMRAHAQYLDALLAGLCSDIVSAGYVVSLVGTDNDTKLASIADVEKVLNINKAPMDSRVCVLSPAAKAQLIVVPSFLNAEKRGDTDALRNASLGRIFGMDFYTDQNIVEGHNLAFHKNAFALVTAPLLPPLGGARAAVENYKGLSCRVVYGYDMNKKVDTVSIDMLVGVKTLTEELAVVLTE